MLEWWEFYTSVFYKSGQGPVVLQRNLARVEQARQARADATAAALQETIRKDARTAKHKSLVGKVLQWSDVASPAKKVIPVVDELLKDAEPVKFTHNLKPSSPLAGQRQSGVIELRIYSGKSGQLLVTNTQNSKFIVDNNTIYLCRPISITGPEGLVTAEIYVRSSGIRVSGVLQDGEIKHDKYTIVFSFDLLRAAKEEPTVSYYHESQLILDVKGFKCPFTSHKFNTMEELLRFHASRHLNLLFTVHPLVENAINVTRVPAIAWSPQREMRFIKEKIDGSMLEMRLFSSGAVLGKRPWADDILG